MTWKRLAIKFVSFAAVGLALAGGLFVTSAASKREQQAEAAYPPTARYWMSAASGYMPMSRAKGLIWF